MNDDQKHHTEPITAYDLRHWLLVISTTLFFIPIFYQILFILPFILQGSTQSLFILGCFGYAILIADIISEVFKRTFPFILSHYQLHTTFYNQIFFVILSFGVIFLFFLLWGLDAIKEISIALAFIILGWLWNKYIKKESK